MSYHITNTRNPNHLKNRDFYGQRHPLGIQWLHNIWDEPASRLPFSGFAKSKKRRKMARDSRRKNRRS